MTEQLDAADAAPPVSIDLVFLGDGAALREVERAWGGTRDSVRLTPTQVAALTFDGVADRWIVATAGANYAARIVIADTEPAQRVGLIPLDASVARVGNHLFLEVARRGFPNYFVVTDRGRVDHVLSAVTAFFRRGTDRVEVKLHAQAQYGRNIDAGLQRLNPKGSERQVLADYEYTFSHERQDDEDYRGPAVIVTADGQRHEVQVHLLSVYQPIENAVRWTGRVLSSPAQRALHHATNQPIEIQIGDNPQLPGLLVDADPWGGSHIVGVGASPYPMPLIMEMTNPSRL